MRKAGHGGRRAKKAIWTGDKGMNRTEENRPEYISYPILISLEIIGLLLFGIPAISMSYILKYIDAQWIIILIIAYFCSIPLFAVISRVSSAHWKIKIQSVSTIGITFGGIYGGLLGIFCAFSNVNKTEKIIIVLTALAFGIVTGEIAAGIVNRMAAGKNKNIL
jgi:hypothetical protein